MGLRKQLANQFIGSILDYLEESITNSIDKFSEKIKEVKLTPAEIDVLERAATLDKEEAVKIIVELQKGIILRLHNELAPQLLKELRYTAFLSNLLNAKDFADYKLSVSTAYEGCIMTINVISVQLTSNEYYRAYDEYTVFKQNVSTLGNVINE